MTEDKTCCGRSVATPYCPYCGKQALPADPMSTLIAHLRHTVKIKEGALRVATERHKKEPHDYLLNDIRKAKLGIVKWSAWVAALTEVIESREKEHQ